MSFADQMARKAEQAERRADRYEYRAEAAEKRGEALQAPINRMHGDIAFFTQPNINTSAGRAFARKRESMWQSFERGFEEFNKSAYWQSRAKTARATANQKELQEKGFIMRRIMEREADIRAFRRNVEEREAWLEIVEAANASGETPRDKLGWEIRSSREEIEHSIEHWLERIEVKLDELGFYQDCLDALGGVQYGRDNLAKGDLITIGRWKTPVRYLRGGPKNFTYEFTEPHMRLANGTPMQGAASYAEIKEVKREIPDRPGCYEKI